MKCSLDTKFFLQLHGLEQPLVRNVVWVRHTEETRSLFVLQMQLFYLAPQPPLLLLLLSLSRATTLPIILCNNCHFPCFMRASEHHVICLASVTLLYATCFTFLVDMTTKMVYYIPLAHCFAPSSAVLELMLPSLRFDGHSTSYQPRCLSIYTPVDL